MEKPKKIAFVSSYSPRKCGIATFTTDLITALSVRAPETECWAIALNDSAEGYTYPHTVHFEINQNKPNEYRLAGEFLNINQVDLVCLQHEYGIFGGQAGSYIVQLLKSLRMPVVSTLHTVLKNPTVEQKYVLLEIAKQSSRLVVMADKAKDFLQELYAVEPEKISFIHHGIPDIPFIDPNFYKDLFDVENRKVLLTFGLLSSNKGIEYMIQALPDIVTVFPETVYIVLGTTHPQVQKVQGENYRVGLERLAWKLGVDKHVMFFNHFVDPGELSRFLGCADIYVTPYLNEAQMVSGTLISAMGAGKAAVSTPYWYAREMLADDRGVLVPFKDSPALARAVIELLGDEGRCTAIRKHAYAFTRSAVWHNVASEYVSLFNRVKEERSSKPHTRSPALPVLGNLKMSLPDINFNHLYTLTDDTGILQHSSFTVPDYTYGYCIDDNARGLIVAITGQTVVQDEHALHRLEKRCLSFIKHAYNEDNGRFRNFMHFSRQWKEVQGSQDSCGRTFWGLGICCALSADSGCAALSATLLHKSLKRIEQLHHPRAIAYALVGMHAYLAKFSGDSEVRRARDLLGERLFFLFKNNLNSSWPWFDDIVTYGNGKIPQALLLCGKWMNRLDMLDAAYQVLNWLVEKQTDTNHFSPIGNAGWMKRSGEKARFDQQPIEAQDMLEACLSAYRLTGDKKYKHAAEQCFHWFLGQNDLNTPLYDYITGGCRDGLQPDGANLNQGAESTLAWLIALIAMHGFYADQTRLLYLDTIQQ